MKKRQNAELRKPDILKNFYEVIVKEGFEGASIGKVAKRMKIHPSLIIHYFENKDNMTIELVDYVLRIYSRLFIQFKENRKGKKSLKMLIDIFMSDEWYSLTNIAVDFAVISVSFRNKKVFSRIQTLYGEFRNMLVSEIEPMIKDGTITIKDPESAAELIMTALEGYRHFKHFFVSNDKTESYRHSMSKALLTMLTAN